MHSVRSIYVLIGICCDFLGAIQSGANFSIHGHCVKKNNQGRRIQLNGSEKLPALERRECMTIDFYIDGSYFETEHLN